MKAHVGAYAEGNVHSGVVMDASVPDLQIMGELLHGEEQSAHGDKAYANSVKQAQADVDEIGWRVNRKANRGRKLNFAVRAFNKKNNLSRAIREHSFRIIKDLCAYSKVKYKGIHENAVQILSLFVQLHLYICQKNCWHYMVSVPERWGNAPKPENGNSKDRGSMHYSTDGEHSLFLQMFHKKMF